MLEPGFFKAFQIHRLLAALTAVIITLAIASSGIASDGDKPWPAPVDGFVAPEAGEHPRLLFRRSDLPELRRRAQAPEGQAILKRLREVLNGGDGRTMPGNMGHGPRGGDFAHAGAGGTFSISHVAGYGLLYQVTGDRHYADLGRRAMDAALAGHRGGDQRYSFRSPSGALRAGPSLGWYALGYDLCYDGWDEEYRRKIASEIAGYNQGRNMSLAELVRGARHHPRSNHWGMQVGGGAMALLAVRNDPGVDNQRIEQLVEVSRQAMIRNMTEGFGEGLYFAEGDGTASMASHIIFLSALQAWKTAAGKDFITPRPHAQWMSLRWLLGTIVDESGRPHFHSRDGYPHNTWQRHSISGGAYFGIGMGVATPPQRAAWLWFYNQFFKEHDQRNGVPYDTAGSLPHHSVLAFVNWPVGEEPVNPIEAIPPAAVDRHYGYAMFRNRFQDENDIVVTVLTKRARGHTQATEINRVWISANAAQGRFALNPRHATTGIRERPDASWGRMNGDIRHFEVRQDASAVMTTSDGTSLALDFSGRSGVDAVLIMTGPGAPGAEVEGTTVLNAGGTSFSILFLTRGQTPTPRAEGDRVRIGQQVVSLRDGNLVLHHVADPWAPKR
ncbi:MAG: hypothetical protein JJU36_16100 [Phycisphaeraceae bacterium]|nr:hypothetical protein [Phycisphaeraceae bacterium]